MSGAPGLVSFVLLGDRLPALHGLLAAAFTSPWVASYQIGFGPPLVKSSDRLLARLQHAKSALEKLDAYLDVCFLNDDERRRLAGMFRRLTVRRLGPIDAETLDEASAEVLDLVIRLHHPALAPNAVASEMRAADVPADLLPLRVPPDTLSGRFFVRLGDPRGSRLLHHRQVEERGVDPESALALELRVPVGVRMLYAAWLKTLVGSGKVGAAIELEELAPHAKTSTDGERR